MVRQAGVQFLAPGLPPHPSLVRLIQPRDQRALSKHRINDDKHQLAGMGHLAADHNVVGRVFFSGKAIVLVLEQYTQAPTWECVLGLRQHLQKSISKGIAIPAARGRRMNRGFKYFN
jgi:hypothetical protein